MISSPPVSPALPWPIQADHRLTVNAHDLGLKWAGSTLLAPPAVAQLLRSMEVSDATLLIPTMETWSTTFLQEEVVACDDLDGLRERVGALLHHNGVRWMKFSPIERALGAVQQPRASGP